MMASQCRNSNSPSALHSLLFSVGLWMCVCVGVLCVMCMCALCLSSMFMCFQLSVCIAQPSVFCACVSVCLCIVCTACAACAVCALRAVCALCAVRVVCACRIHVLCVCCVFVCLHMYLQINNRENRANIRERHTKRE